MRSAAAEEGFTLPSQLRFLWCLSRSSNDGTEVQLHKIEEVSLSTPEMDGEQSTVSVLVEPVAIDSPVANLTIAITCVSHVNCVHVQIFRAV